MVSGRHCTVGDPGENCILVMGCGRLLALSHPSRRSQGDLIAEKLLPDAASLSNDH